MDARGWLLRASLGLIVIPLDFSDFTVKAADFVKTDSANGAAMWVDRSMSEFPLNPDWKIVRVRVRLQDGTKSRQTYLIDFPHSKSALIETDGKIIPVSEWSWRPIVPEIR